MDRRDSPDDLLSHFDRPKTLALPDFEWVDDLLSTAPPREERVIAIEPAGDTADSMRHARRGIPWVLKWAAALAVLGVAGSVLLQFTRLLAAERRLWVAARAGVLEATLPRATPDTVTAVIDRRLAAYPLLSQLRITLTQNDSPVGKLIRARDGDRFAVTLEAPLRAFMPRWLSAVSYGSERRIQAHANRQMPGRTLVLGASLPISPKQ